MRMNRSPRRPPHCPTSLPMDPNAKVAIGSKSMALDLRAEKHPGILKVAAPTVYINVVKWMKITSSNINLHFGMVHIISRLLQNDYSDYMLLFTGNVRCQINGLGPTNGLESWS